MQVLWTDLKLSDDFIFVEWIKYGGDDTYSEYLERPVYLHDGFEFLLLDSTEAASSRGLDRAQPAQS